MHSVATRCRAAAPAIAFLLALAHAAPVEAQADSTITVVTYNIHAGKDAEQRPNLDRVAAVLDTLGADIVLLQEVDRRTRRSAGVDQIGELERLTGMRGAFGKSLDYQGGEYGIAALSRWPIELARVLPLPTEPPLKRSNGSYDPLVALHVVVATPAGRVHVVNTHLTAEGPGTNRKQQLVALLAHVRRLVPPGEALVVGGDFNARPESDEIAATSLALADAWAACGEGAGHSFPAHAPDRRIDYLFLRGLRCTGARVHATTASDHRPVVVEVRPARRGGQSSAWLEAPAPHGARGASSGAPSAQRQ
ncbi:MAG TPA: endonuclease/exonuclease/phosphatase family protein [Longimicrobiales bacterium]